MKRTAAPSIKATFTEAEMRRIEKGPLRFTAGRGKQAWLHRIAMLAVKAEEEAME
jgi:hypothetical protein